ncbi:Hypothetical protein NTJ_13031 [Nesidiocoris tenuis]|uniref:Uncharacterized protein n=1 Tax=Nesidiocoris tenuis TaxID=355587 RepID=A0ABN7B9B2_9HEMI|nr:Hypothetical protein NTJ_13031 [Nesidiocoris tenuis]
MCNESEYSSSRHSDEISNNILRCQGTEQLHNEIAGQTCPDKPMDYPGEIIQLLLVFGRGRHSERENPED